MRINRARSKRRAVAGILAAVILFAMLFTVGTGYFLFVNSQNGLYQATYFSNADKLAAKINENLELTTLTVSSTKNIGFYVNNTGGSTGNVTAYYLVSSTGSVLQCAGKGMHSPCTNSTAFPMILNVGKGTLLPSTLKSYFDTGYLPTSGAVYTVKILTANGNVYSAQYPPSAVALAAQALSSGAIGDLYISFHTFSWYLINFCSGGSGPYCLTYKGLAFSVPCSQVSNAYIGFSITMTDLNTAQKNITLDQYTVLNSFIPPKSGGGGANPSLVYYIVSNTSTTISNTYTPVTLSYNTPKTIVFASGSPDGVTGFAPTGPKTQSGQNNVCSSPPQITFSFTITHGCQALALTRCNTAGNDNYGQVAPYVSTLFY
jgi:hypothetical protein